MSATAIQETIAAVLATYSAPPPIFAENFSIPTSVSSGEWVRWSIRIADTFDSTVGADKERAVGTLFFQHFVPEGTGTKKAYVFADKIGVLLNRLTAGASGVIRFGRAVCAYAGTIGGKVQHNITVEFQWDSEALNAP